MSKEENNTFDFAPRTRIIFGNDSLRFAAELAIELGAGTVLIVTDAGVSRAGHLDRLLEVLKSSGLRPLVFDGVRENPTTRDVDACLSVVAANDIDVIIGLGGGSSLDTAKGCNFLLTNGGQMGNYRGFGKADKPMLPMIAIPTTAGTGSETQSFALIADETTHQKMACGDLKAVPKIAILDPILTLSQPENVTKCAGIDSITHALESAVTSRRNGISAVFSKEAFRLTQWNFCTVLKDPDDITARGNMLLGAAYAGLAIENSMLGAAHAAANPLTAHYNIPHGEAVGIMLPWVVSYNRTDEKASIHYADLAAATGIVSPRASIDNAVDSLIMRLEKLVKFAGFTMSLNDRGIQSDALSVLAEEAAKQWTAGFNPRKIEASDFENLYRQRLYAESAI